MFHRISRVLRHRYGVDRFSYVGSDSYWYDGYILESPEFAEEAFLGEWMIAQEAEAAEPDVSILRRFESRYGESLWNAAICDRRLITGWNSASLQDYRPRCSEDVILKRLQTACLRISDWFDRMRPDAVVGFNCVTYIEYLTILEAKVRSIPVRNIRPVRIRNFVAIDDGIFDPPSALVDQYRNASARCRDESRMLAREVLLEFADKPMSYEGTAKTSATPGSPAMPTAAPALHRTRHQPRRARKYALDTHSAYNRHHFFYHRLRKPYFEWRNRSWLASRYVGPNDLGKEEFAFFPMHLEPELALLLFAPAYQNQIEVIRTIARGLPAGMKLWVKDHPLGFKRRKLGYYQKLLHIPNVRLVDPNLPAKELIERSKLVTLIGGSIGIEALIRRKPLLVLSPHTTFGVMHPCSMLRFTEHLNSIDREIRSLLENYRFDEEILLRFIATSIETAVPLNLYSGLLGRKDVNSYVIEGEQDEFSRAAAFLWNSLHASSQFVSTEAR